MRSQNLQCQWQPLGKAYPPKLLGQARYYAVRKCKKHLLHVLRIAIPFEHRLYSSYRIKGVVDSVKNNEYFYTQKKMERPAEQPAELTRKLRQRAMEKPRKRSACMMKLCDTSCIFRLAVFIQITDTRMGLQMRQNLC